MRVLICGCRDFNDNHEIMKVISRLNPKRDTIIHGGARGADTLAGDIAKARGFKVKVYHADWEQYGRAAGPIRNKEMIEKGKPDKVYAFFTNKEKSKGTKNMTMQARKAGIKVIEYPPEIRRLC